LNGFIWGLWGVHDYALATGSKEAAQLEADCIETIADNLHRFDTGTWSLYDLSATGTLKMITSSFYHRLHIVQLEIMATLTDNPIFAEYAERWDGYSRKRWNRTYSKAYKALFKVLNY
jgi:heparosan-N-sulfate-glucuronate 5-epimerase